MKIVKKQMKNYRFIKAVIGFQYPIVPVFLDKKGEFIEKCRKIFVPGTPLNIELGVPEGVKVQAKNPPVEIDFSPAKTVISQVHFFPLKDFETMVAKFYGELNDFYINCNFEFIGAVLEANIITEGKTLDDLSNEIKIFNNKFKSYAGSFNDMKLTYVRDGYRFHFQSTIKDSQKGTYAIALDTQKIKNVAFSDIQTIITTCEREFATLIRKI